MSCDVVQSKGTKAENASFPVIELIINNPWERADGEASGVARFLKVIHCRGIADPVLGTRLDSHTRIKMSLQ